MTGAALWPVLVGIPVGIVLGCWLLCIYIEARVSA